MKGGKKKEKKRVIIYNGNKYNQNLNLNFIENYKLLIKKSKHMFN